MRNVICFETERTQANGTGSAHVRRKNDAGLFYGVTENKGAALRRELTSVATG